jgi:hypothetical protein
MAEAPMADDWPSYLPGPAENILALGVIALAYGQLENMFRALFASITQMNEFQVAALFQRLPNNIRKVILFELMTKTVLPQRAEG